MKRFHNWVWVVVEKRRRFSGENLKYVTRAIVGPRTENLNEAKRFATQARAKALIFAMGWEWLVARQLPGWMS